MNESSISVELALNLLRGAPIFEFFFSTEHGPTNVVINSEGVVRVANDAYGLIESIVECLEANLNIEFQVGANYSGIVLRFDDRTCKVLIPPFGEGLVDPMEAKAAGWVMCEIVEVWVKEVMDSVTFTLSAQEVKAPER